MEKYSSDKIAVEQELAEIAPTLAQLRHKISEPIAPEGYFETLADRTIETANITVAPMPLKVVARRPMWHWGIAASVAVLVVAAIFYGRNQASQAMLANTAAQQREIDTMAQQAKEIPAIAMLETDEIKDYVRANARDLDAQQRLEHQKTLRSNDSVGAPLKANADPKNPSPNVQPKPEKTNTAHFDPAQLSDEELEQYLQEHADEIDIL